MSTSAKRSKKSEIDAETDALDAIDSCQNEIDAINEKASEEILQIEQRYNTLRRPFYVKRSEIIKNIPSFWSTAITQHPQISSILEQEEEECLQYIDKLDVEEEDIKSGYKISFHFNENPYFENNVLTKEFNLENYKDIPTSCSTAIKWKPHKNLAIAVREKAIRHSRKRNLDFKTFFEWFCDNTDPINDEVAEVIKDDLWPNPLQYYLVPELEVGNDDDENDDAEENDADEQQGDDNEDSEQEEEAEEEENADDDDEA